MPKKPQPQAKGSQKNKLQIVDEQNEPTLRALHKKIRNINKKLTEIAELEHKENLKPEQIEKINRKDSLLEERAKFEEYIQFFKETLIENAEHYRNNQLKELQILANAVIVFKGFPQFVEYKKVEKLWKGLNSVDGANLTQAANNLAKTLKQFANDHKLQKALTAFITENVQTSIQEEAPQEEAPEKQNEVHTDEIIILHEETTNEKGEPEEVEIVEKIHDGVVEEITISVVDDKNKEGSNPTPISNTPKDQIPQETDKKDSKVEEERPKTRKYDRPYRGKDNNRERQDDFKGERRGNEGRRFRENRDNQEGGEKRSYRPKYQERDEERPRNPPKESKVEEEDNSSDSDAQVRTFKKEEIRQLEEDGFIVVGKPKPKARDQMNVYSHQHGRNREHHNLNHH